MSRNRWSARILAGLLAVTGAGGCKQQLFMEPGDYQGALAMLAPKTLETDPHAAVLPPTVDQIGKAPATVDDPDRPAQLVSLRWCIAVALEQGNTGSQSPTNPGLKSDQLPSFTGGGTTRTDSIRAFALDPATVGTNVERALSKFDTRWITSMTWSKQDQPVAAQFLSFQQQRDSANFASTLAKPLPTGGVAGITFSTDYSKFPAQVSNQGGFINPNYTPRLAFTFEQPLLRLFGVEVNQISNQTIGSSLIQGLIPSGGQGVDGILITRIRADQSKAQFEGQVNFMLLNVEAAYWNLYSAYYNLYAREQGLRYSYEGYRFTKGRVEVGTFEALQLNQQRAEFERFRAQVIQARGQVLRAERNLRGLLNLRSDDGTRLVPIDEPNQAPYKPDFYEAANDTMASKPELMVIRQELKVAQLQLVLAKNLRQPDLRLNSSYDVAGLGTRLDGPAFSDANRTVLGNALTNLGNNQFNSWSVGLRLDMPLGFRDANAGVRQSQLGLTQRYVELRNAEMTALEFLVEQYRQVIESHKLIAPLRERRKQLQEYVYRALQKIEIGRFTENDFFQYLQNQRDLADAIGQEFQAVATYNSSLAGLEYAKGTIQRYNNVTVNDGPLPPWVQKRAADHVRERTEAAIELRERALAGAPGPVGTHPVGPAGGSPTALDLPPFAERQPPMPGKEADFTKPLTADEKERFRDKSNDKAGDPLPPPNRFPADPLKTDPPKADPVDPKKGPPSAGMMPGQRPATTVPVGAPGDYFQPVDRVVLPPRRPMTYGPPTADPMGERPAPLPVPTTPAGYPDPGR